MYTWNAWGTNNRQLWSVLANEGLKCDVLSQQDDGGSVVVKVWSRPGTLNYSFAQGCLQKRCSMYWLSMLFWIKINPSTVGSWYVHTIVYTINYYYGVIYYGGWIWVQSDTQALAWSELTQEGGFLPSIGIAWTHSSAEFLSSGHSLCGFLTIVGSNIIK